MENGDTLGKLKQLRRLVNESMCATTAESRKNSITEVKQFLHDWSKELKHLERNRKMSVWSRLFSHIYGATSVSSDSSSSETADSSSATSASSGSGVDRSTAEDNASSNSGQLSLMTSASADRPPVAHKSAAIVGYDSREAYDSYCLQTITEEEEAASLALMTCGSAGDDDAGHPSVGQKSIAILGYDNRKAYDPYCLQTVCENQPTEADEQVSGFETTYSTGEVSSYHESITTTRVDKTVMNYEGLNEMALKSVLDSVTALFEGSDEGLTVDVLEVTPCEQSAPTSSVDITQRDEEVESLRESGIVRQLINVFNRFV